MNNKMLNRILVILITIFFIGTNIIPSISSDYNNEQDTIALTFFTFDKSGTKECKVEIPTDAANIISDTFEEFRYKITRDPASSETKALKNSFVELLDRYDLIPHGLSKDYIVSLLNPRWLQQIGNNNLFRKSDIPRSADSIIPNDVISTQLSHFGSAVFCSLAGTGRGLIFTPIIFPRPRLLTLWSSFSSAVSTAANLYTGHGFAASGIQTGIAFGFWGIGLSFAIPGEPAVFGFGGYALLALVKADDIETYPLNKKPVVSDENPSDSSVDIPVGLSELSFRISDPDGDRMSYIVTTDPDIGGGEDSGFDGVFSIPISGLQGNTDYSWQVVVSDKEDITEKNFSFSTEAVAPVMSDPLPADGSKNVFLDLTELSFKLEDFQGDLMDFSVETVPDIGSGFDEGVGNGTYSIGISNMDYNTTYQWFVNVSDGYHWTRVIYTFETRPKGLIILNPIDDTTIVERSPDTPKGDSESIRNRNHGGGDWTYQGLIKFDISSIPIDIDLVSATLNCYYRAYKDNNPNGNTFNLYRITSEWDEDDVTWNTQPTCEYYPTSFVIMPSSPGVWLKWDVKSDIEDFINGYENNFGWKISDDTLWQGASIPITYLNSKENEENIPELWIWFNE